MKAWTDYPFTCLGDKEYKKAPIREIEVISYNQDKYCLVRIDNVISEYIKSGYIYQSKGRCGEVEPITKAQLSTLPISEFES